MLKFNGASGWFRPFPGLFSLTLLDAKKACFILAFIPIRSSLPKTVKRQMYRGMEGSLWIDPAQECIVKIEGKLVKDVSFGWGILGRLSKGGVFEIAQTQLAPGTWRITSLNVDMKGRILLLDSFRFVRRETDTRLRSTPASMTYQSAVTALLAAPAVSDWDKPAGPPAPPRSRKHQSSSTLTSPLFCNRSDYQSHAV